MKRTAIAIAVSVVLVGCGDSEKSRPTGPTSPAADVSAGDMAALVKGNNQFALDLYGQISGESGNLFLSPYSISAALAMTYAGARGETADEMAGALRFGLDQDRLHPAYQSLLYRLHGRGGRGYELSAANRLWGQAGYAFDPDYLNLTLKHYGAELATVDFVNKADAARRTINAWVEDQTNDKIKDLIAPGVLDGMTRLVLTNAIYFKGNWHDEFEKGDTHDAPFHLNDQKDVEVRMMYREGRYRYAKKDGLAVLSIPYKGNDLSMMILLPDEVEGVGGLEGQLTLENIAWWESGLAWDEVHVYLPKFRFSARFSLREALEALGMERAFSVEDADLSGMSGQEELFIAAVVHQAFVDVNEKGTEAAAATDVVVDAASDVAKRPTEFRADHPFVFMIRDDETGAILFQGRLANPDE